MFSLCSISFSSARIYKIAHRVQLENLNENVELVAQRVLGVSVSYRPPEKPIL